MIDVMFVILYLIIPVFIILLMKASGLSLFKITIPSFVIISMFLFAYIGIPLLYFGWDDYSYSLGVQDKIIVLKVFAFTSWTMITLLFGFIFANSLLTHGGIQSSYIGIRSLNYKESIILIIMLLICLFVLGIYITKIPRIALLVALKEDVTELNLARSLMGNEFSGKYHWYSLVMHDVLNFVTFTLYANWIMNKKNSTRLLFIISFIGSSFAATMATEKAPFIWLCIGIFLVYIFVKRDGLISTRSVIKLGFFLLIPLILFYIFFAGFGSPVLAMKGIFSRTFAAQIAPAYIYLEYFPKQEDFLWGRGIDNPGGILPFIPYSVSVEIANWISPHLVAQGVVGSQPTIFWGDMYANFGILGVVIVPFIVGVFLYLLTYFVGKLENTPIKIGLVVWLSLHYGNLAQSGLGGYIFDFFLIMMVSITLIVIGVANKGKIKYIRYKTTR